MTNKSGMFSSATSQNVFGSVKPLAEPLESRLLLSGGFLYDAENEGPRRSGGLIAKRTPGSNTVVVPYDVETGQFPVGLQVVGTDLFVLSGIAQGAGGPSSPGFIGRYTQTGTAINANLVSSLSDPTSMVIAGSDIFVCESDGTVGEYTTSGATVNATLISGLNEPSITASGSDLFIYTAGNQTVGEYTFSGSPIHSALISNLNSDGSLVSIGSDLFIATSAGVAEYSTSGTLINADFAPTGVLATDQTDLFVYSSSLNEYTTAGTLVSTTDVDFPGPYAVAPAAPTNAALQLAYSTPPTDIQQIAGTPLTNTVQVLLQDEAGELAANNSENVTLSIASGPTGAVLGGTTTVALDQGSATFNNVTFNVAGTYTLTASDGIDAPVTSASFTVTVLPFPHLSFSNPIADVSFPLYVMNDSVNVDLVDDAGDISDPTNPVTLNIGTGPAGATLGGVTTEQPGGSSISFNQLSFSIPGTYTLIASDGVHASATSNLFTVDQLVPRIAAFSDAAGGNPQVTLSAIVAPDPIHLEMNGSVTFVDENGNTIGTAPLQSNNTASLSTSFFDPTIHTITAHYSGDGLYSAASSTPITVSALPTLSSAQAIFNKAVIPLSVIAGSKLNSRIALTVTNAGANALTGKVSVVLFAEPVGGADGSQIRLTSLSRAITLKKGKTSRIGIPLSTIPSTLPAGNYHLLAELMDSTGAITTATQTDTLSVVAPFVSPAVVLGKLPSVAAGKSAAITLSVSNQGNILAKGLSITLTAQTAAGTPMTLASLKYPKASLKPRQTAKITIKFKVPIGTTDGGYLLTASVTAAGVTASDTVTSA